MQAYAIQDSAVNHSVYLEMLNSRFLARRLESLLRATPRCSYATATESKRTVVKPLEHPDFFDVKKLVNLKEMFDARVHYGHHIGLRNPWMKEFIFGTRMDIDIINLEITCESLKNALNVLAHIAFRKGIILFVTRDPAAIPHVERLAKETGEYAHCRRWHQGTFSDSISRFGTVIRFPDLVVFLNTNDAFNEQHKAIREAANMLIPTMGIVDTNTDPNLVTYPVPGNDDTIQSIEYYCDLFKKTVLKAKEKRKELESQPGVIIE